MHCRLALLSVALLIALGRSSVAGTPGGGAQPIEVRALANAGVLVRSGGAAILIDALFREGVPGYATPSTALRADLEGAQADFSAVRLVLVTHWHRDHFDPAAVAGHLARNRGAVLVAAEQVVTPVQAAGADAAQLRITTPGVGGILRVPTVAGEVSVVRLRHNPSRNYPSQHVGQAVRLAGRLLIHVGDADPQRDNFRAAEPLAPVDVALVPYWYLLDAAGRAILRDQLRARHVVALHVEPAEAARIRAEVTRAWPGAVIFTAAGQSVRF